MMNVKSFNCKEHLKSIFNNAADVFLNTNSALRKEKIVRKIPLTLF